MEGRFSTLLSFNNNLHMKNKVNTFRLLKQPSMKYKDKETKQPLTPPAPTEFRMFGVGRNPKKEGRMEAICYDPNETSIFLSEHVNKSPDKPSIEYMKFKYGYSEVSDDEVTKMEFIKAWGLNASIEKSIPGVTPKFEFVDEEAIIQKDIDSYEVYDKAVGICWDATEEQVLAMASYKNIPAEGFNSIKSLRYALKTSITRSEAETFYRDFTSERVMKRYHLIQAIERGEIVDDVASKNFVWASSRSIIVSYSGQNPIDALTNHCLSPQGRIFYDTLTSDSVKNAEATAKVMSNTTTIESSSNVDLTVDQMVKLAIEQKALQPNSEGMFYFGGSKCGSDVDAVIKHIGDRPKKIEELKELLKL